MSKLVNSKEEADRMNATIKKAELEMLAIAEKKTLETNKITQEEKEQSVKNIRDAVEETYVEAETDYNLTKEQIENTTYKEVDEKYVKTYNEHLVKRGITDEQVRDKTMFDPDFDVKEESKEINSDNIEDNDGSNT